MGSTFVDIVETAEAGGLPTDEVTIVTSPADGAALARLERQLIAAAEYDEQHNEPATAPVVAAEIEKLEATAETRTFIVQALSDKAWSDLERAHPPGDGDHGRYNPDTFEPAAIAACIVDPPGATVDLVDRLRASVAPAEWAKLRGAVIGLNLAGQSPPSLRLGRPYVDLLASAPN